LPGRRQGARAARERNVLAQSSSLNGTDVRSHDPARPRGRI
jgi:hypothetical protein